MQRVGVRSSPDARDSSQPCAATEPSVVNTVVHDHVLKESTKERENRRCGEVCTTSRSIIYSINNSIKIVEYSVIL